MRNSSLENSSLENEGRVLMRYLLGRAPAEEPVRLYAAAVARQPEPEPLRLPRAVMRYPWLLRVMEPIGKQAPHVSSRLRIAMILAEATPAGRERLFPASRGGKTRALIGLVAMMTTEAALLLPRAVLARWLARRIVPGSPE